MRQMCIDHLKTQSEDYFKIKDESIYRWFHMQQKLCRDNELLKDREEKLRELNIGFCSRSEPRRRLVSKKHDERWDEQYQKLQKYHQDNGNCCVPAKWPEDTKFGYWVLTQRRLYLKIKKGQGYMKPERVEKLDELDFGSSSRKLTRRN